jgi:hypothetical protein
VERKAAGLIMGSVRIVQHLSVIRLANPPFDQHFQIRRTILIISETEVERVSEPIHAEMVRTTCVGSIQKRTVNDTFCHNTLRAGACANNEYRQAMRHSVNPLIFRAI